MKNTLLLVTLAGLTAHASAATALIDFGRTTNITAGYNNVSNNNATALADTAAGATGWTIAITPSAGATSGTAGSGQAGAGADVSTFPVALSSFAVTALQDSYFINQGNTSPIQPSAIVSLSGLNPGMAYDLLFYGSRNNLQNAFQTWHITQSGGLPPADVSHNSLLNSSTVVDWQGVIPTVGGVIAFSVSSPSGTPGALALNFGSITEVAQVPEPSALVLLGLAGSLLGLRRRR